MRVRSVAAFAALMASAVFSAAGAQDEAAHTTFPEPLEAAIQEAETLAADAPRFSFTRTVELETHDARFVARFNPEAEEGARWTLVEPSEEALEGQARQAWLNMQSEDEADIDVLVDEPRDFISGDAAESEASEEAVLFLGALGEAVEIEGGDAIREALRVSVEVAREGPRLNEVRIFAEGRFRPSMIVRVDRFDQTIGIGDAWEDGPLVITRVDQSIAGSAMFQDFAEDVTLTHSDFSPAR